MTMKELLEYVYEGISCVLFIAVGIALVLVLAAAMGAL